MLARVLIDCGVYMGPSQSFHEAISDNQEGYWEDQRFQSVNEQILALFGGRWDRPDLPDDWLSDSRLEGLRAEATSLVDSNRRFQPWGWKDPRSCLTFGFWRDLIPGLKVVIAVRSPVEVARSLLHREYESVSYARGLQLWEVYYRSLENSLGDTPHLVVHSDRMFTEPAQEIARICGFFNLEPSEEMLAKAAGSVRPELRRARFPDAASKSAQLSGEIVSLYRELCDQAGPALKSATASDATWSESLMQESIESLERLLDVRTERVEQLYDALSKTQADRDDLREEIARITSTRWHRLGVGIRRFLRK